MRKTGSVSLREFHDKQDAAERQEVVSYARQVQAQTGCSWGEAIRIGEKWVREDKRQ